MKMSTLSVIFAIIIIPITMAVSIYVNTQVDTLTLQTSYDTKLSNATYDAVKAFQLNETNSNTQNIATEKIRDLEASVETFYNSLAMSLGYDAFGEEQLSPYVPAIAYTLYDGYYIYAPFLNKEKVDALNPNGTYQNGVKPFIYYSARYKTSTKDITVNYTLDNYVTIYGIIGSNYVTKSGYLINPDDVNVISDTQLTYKGITIGGENNLKEINSESYVSKTEIPYVYKATENNQREKVYYDSSTNKWYRISLDRKRLDLKAADYPSNTDYSAYNYYKDAKDFSLWVRSNLGDLTLSNAVNYTADADLDKNIYYISDSKDNDKIFNLSSANDPENEKSVFNDHRRNVIKYAIQTNLTSAIAGYNSISQVNDTTYNFKMPVLSEEDWDKVLNNVSVISFMQGFPIKNKYYNGYSIVTNNKNREFIDPDFIYFVSDSSTEFHSVYDSSALVPLASNIVGYRNLDFARKRINKSDNTTEYYYQHWKESCYNCIVTGSVRATATTLAADGSEKTLFEYINELRNGNANQKNIAKAYYTAIGRERYNSYKSNKLY